MYQVYTPRIWDFKSQSRDQGCVNYNKLQWKIEGTMTRNTIKYNETDIQMGYNSQNNIGINKIT